LLNGSVALTLTPSLTAILTLAGAAAAGEATREALSAIGAAAAAADSPRFNACSHICQTEHTSFYESAKHHSAAFTVCFFVKASTHSQISQCDLPKN